jgi:hypothetical protein
MTPLTAWTRRDFLRRLFGLLAEEVARPQLGHAKAPASAPDWPGYRHDVALTGVSPGRGRIATPRVLWEHYVSVPLVPVATDRLAKPADVADLDGDGRPERYHLDGQTIRVTDLAGKLLWSHTVTGRPLGGNVRVPKLFADRRGLQIISFSSRMDTGEGQGYCFAFDKGAEKGELLWTTGPLTGHYAPTLVIDDMDGDGNPEIVVAPHYRVQIFDGQTGRVKAEVPWDVGRNIFVVQQGNNRYCRLPKETSQAAQETAVQRAEAGGFGG